MPNCEDGTDTPTGRTLGQARIKLVRDFTECLYSALNLLLFSFHSALGVMKQMITALCEYMSFIYAVSSTVHYRQTGTGTIRALRSSKCVL